MTDRMTWIWIGALGLCVAAAVVALLVLLGSTGSAPFVYTLF